MTDLTEKEEKEIEEKRCGKCGLVKPVSEFFKRQASKDGYNSRCKKCKREYMREYTNRPHIKQHIKDWDKAWYKQKVTEGYWGRCGDCDKGLWFNNKTGFCRNCLTGENCHWWKGGIAKRGGYLLVLSKDHPNADSRGYVLEHRLIMGKHMGRYLNSEETVHHKNGKRNDNRIENLELRTGKHGTNITISDAIVYAKKILEQYGNDETKYN